MNEIYQGIPVESESEIMVLDWLFELKEKGFIHSIERSPEMLVSKGLENKYVKKVHKISKVKLIESVKEIPREETILQPHYYTPEFSVLWYDHTPQSLVWPLYNIGQSGCTAPLIGHTFPVPTELHPSGHGLITYLEVKPKFDFQNMGRLFRLNQKWMWESRKMYINLLEPTNLYKHTFTPVNYLKTRKTKTEREIKWNIRSVDEYLKLIGYETPISQPVEDRPHQEQNNEGV